MNSNLICNNCGKENPLYDVNCNFCGSYLREKIFNIDLWSTISLLIESPVKGFRKIIQAEHKNFLVLILAITFIKFWVDSVFISLAFYNYEITAGNFFSGLFYTTLVTIIILLFVTLIIKLLLKKIKTRYIDLFSIFTYSQIPHFFAFLILFPIELIIFGENLFSINPSPFFIKETVAYVMFIIEVLIILWGVLLYIFALYSQTGNKVFAISFGVLGSLLLFTGIFISSTIQFISFNG